MIRNDAQDTYQMRVRVGKTDLEGEWRVSAEPTERYAVVERNHEMRAQYSGRLHPSQRALPADV